MFENIYFGKVDKALTNWRNTTVPEEDYDNDEDLPVAEDVKSILGFDPDELIS